MAAPAADFFFLLKLEGPKASKLVSDFVSLIHVDRTFEFAMRLS